MWVLFDNVTQRNVYRATEKFNKTEAKQKQQQQPQQQPAKGEKREKKQ